MYFHIWKSPLVILLLLEYKAISVAGGKVLLNIPVHICILFYRILLCVHCRCFGCCAAVNEVYVHVLHEYICVCMVYASIPTKGKGMYVYYE